MVIYLFIHLLIGSSLIVSHTIDILPPPNLTVMVGESLRPITT